MGGFNDLAWPYPVNRQHSLNRGLVCWHMVLPTGRGSVAWRNLVGNANAGTLTNMDPKTDWVANARRGGCGSVETDGSNDRVDCGTVAGLNGATYAACAGWIYRASTGTTAGFGGSAGSTTTGNNRWSLIWFSDGKIYINAPTTGGNGRFGSATLSGTGWHWIYLQFIGDGGSDAGRNKLWIDGAPQSLSFSGTGSGTTTIGSVSPWTFGRDSSDRVCGGGYDDIRLALGAAALLTEGEIKALYRESCAGYPQLLRRRAMVSKASITTVQIDLTDSGSGSDGLPAIAAALAASDLAAALDSIAAAAALGQTDTCAGSDSNPTCTTAAGLIDSCSGVDAATVQAAVQLAESCGGVDEIAQLLASLQVAETGQASETVTIAAALSALIESCVGSDVLTAGTIISITDSSAGVDGAPQISVALSLSETAPAADQLAAIAVVLAVIEAGYGTDVAIVNTGTPTGRVCQITFTAVAPYSIEFAATELRTIEFSHTAERTIEFAVAC